MTSGYMRNQQGSELHKRTLPPDPGPILSGPRIQAKQRFTPATTPPRAPPAPGSCLPTGSTASPYDLGVYFIVAHLPHDRPIRIDGRTRSGGAAA
jgi:hypothetical protein